MGSPLGLVSHAVERMWLSLWSEGMTGSCTRKPGTSSEGFVSRGHVSRELWGIGMSLPRPS